MSHHKHGSDATPRVFPCQPADRAWRAHEGVQEWLLFSRHGLCRVEISRLAGVPLQLPHCDLRKVDTQLLLRFRRGQRDNLDACQVRCRRAIRLTSPSAVPAANQPSVLHARQVMGAAAMATCNTPLGSSSPSICTCDTHRV